MVGAFGPLIQEPTGVECTSAQDPAPRCKPGAVTMASLVNGKQLYWNSLEGMNQVDLTWWPNTATRRSTARAASWT